MNNRSRPSLPRPLRRSWQMALVIGLLLSVTLPQSARADSTWTNVASLNTARYAHTATLLPNGRVLVVGGCLNSACTDLASSAEVYDPAANNWTTVAPLSVARYAHTATLLPNGKVLVAGGYDGGRIATTELYDPIEDTWTTIAPLNMARDYHTATLLPDGKVLVAGGYGPSSGDASAELYDPIANTWTYAASMHSGRAGHTATLLPSGRGVGRGGRLGSAIHHQRGGV
jgi:hypothetical protein